MGATVIVKGTASGTSTDLDGNFTINAAQGKTLVVSYVGYTTKEVPVKGTNLKITLNEDAALLDEVVVIGYGTMTRKDLTGSISTVNSKDLNVGAYTDPGQLLQGKVPGLVVVQNSDPNGGVNSITLRGASTPQRLHITSVCGGRYPPALTSTSSPRPTSKASTCSATPLPQPSTVRRQPTASSS